MATCAHEMNGKLSSKCMLTYVASTHWHWSGDSHKHKGHNSHLHKWC